MVDEFDEGIIEPDEPKTVQRRRTRGLLSPHAVDGTTQPTERTRRERILDDHIAVALELVQHICKYVWQASNGPAAAGLNDGSCAARARRPAPRGCGCFRTFDETA